MVFPKKKINFFICSLFFVLSAGFAIETSRVIPDSAVIRKNIVETWLTGSISTVKTKMPELSVNEIGKVFQIRTEPYGQHETAIVIAPQQMISVDVYSESGIENTLAPVYPSETPGCWVLFRDNITGKPTGIRYYFTADSEVYIEFHPESPKTLADFVIFGAYVAKGVPVGLVFEQLYTASFSDIKNWTAHSLPWKYVVVYNGLYNASKGMVSTIQHNLDRVVLTDDCAYDSDTSPIFISSGKPATIMTDDAKVIDVPMPAKDRSSELFLSGAGFTKWIVDGLMRPLSGSCLKVKPLLNKTVDFEQGSLSDVFAEKYNVSFSLDWTRNLAAAALSVSSGTNYFFNNSGADVKIEPFAAIVDEKGYKRVSGYLHDAGYPISILEPLLYVLGTTEPDRFYLGAIRDLDIQSEFNSAQLNFFNRSVALFPYFDESGNFQVSIFIDGIEISLSDFIAQNKDSYIHLVRINASERFSPL